MNLGAFSISLTVKDLSKSIAFSRILALRILAAWLSMAMRFEKRRELGRDVSRDV